MSNVIRAVRQAWTEMPKRMSLDPRVHVPPDHYRFVENQIESQQRQQQSQFARSVRASIPQPRLSDRVQTPFSAPIIATLPLPVK